MNGVLNLSSSPHTRDRWTTPYIMRMVVLSLLPATVVGVACAIEKGFQGGGDALRQAGVNLYSQAVVDKMGPDGIVFRD